MGRFLVGASFLSLALLLFFGIRDPNDSIMWLASTSRNFTILRIVLMSVLLLLLTAGSFINKKVRTVIGVLAFTLFGYTLAATYINHVSIEDGLTLLLSSISAGIVVLEPSSEVSDSSVASAHEPKASTAKAHLAYRALRGN